MYSNKYINDFDLRLYDHYLRDEKKLMQLADAYINQYNNPTYDRTILFKESLDHYISKQLNDNPSYKSTQYFSNYMKYINYIFSKRSDNSVQLEYNTNILFRDSKTRDIILSHYDENTKNKLLSIINKNENIVDSIFKKMASKEKISLKEMNIVSDYLYTKRDLNDSRFSLFIEYLINTKVEYQASPQIVAAYTSLLVKFFGSGCEDTRAVLSNGMSVPADIKAVIPSEIDQYKANKKIEFYGLYSSGDKFISMGWSMIKGLDLNSDLSLNVSRTMKHKDIYWLTMVSFHELTHQLQTRSMKSNEINSTGLSMLIKYAKLNPGDNHANHDSVECEIEADENAWTKMYGFITKFRSRSKLIEDRSEISAQLQKCIVNKESVFARRAIQTKQASDDRFFASDMREIKSQFSRNPNYYNYFNRLRNENPMMMKIFDDHGNINASILFENKLTSKKDSNDENILSCELSNFILNEGYDVLKRHIINDNLSKRQVTNLLENIYTTYHLEKKFVNSLSKLDFSQLSETRTNFNYKNVDILRKKYLEKFKNVASLVYKEREIITMINKKYPEYNIEELFSPKYAKWNYEDMFNHLYVINNGVIKEEELLDVITAYEKTGDPVLVELAVATRNKIGTRSDNISSNKNI